MMMVFASRAAAGVLGVVWLSVGLVAAAPTAHGEDAIRSALHAVHIERRAAILALGRGDRARALTILRRIEARWQLEIAEVPVVRREAEPGLGEAMSRLESSLTRAAALIEQDATTQARALLEDLPTVFDLWRSTRPEPVLSDCLDGFSRRWEPLALAPARRDGALAPALTRAVVESRHMLGQCAALAGPGLAPAFGSYRARFEGSLARLEDALRRGDDAAMLRLIEEQRRLERIIADRFG